MSLPVLTPASKLREHAPAILPAAPGVPLIRKTADLDVRCVWMDGFHSCDWDFPAACAREAWKLEKFLRMAWEKFLAWKAGELAVTHKGQGFALAPYDASLQAPRDFRRFRGGRFWWKGPLETLVIGRYVYAGDEGERDWSGTKGPWQVGRRMQQGDAQLNETGGKIGYRVGGFFLVRETLATNGIDTFWSKHRDD